MVLRVSPWVSYPSLCMFGCSSICLSVYTCTVEVVVVEGVVLEAAVVVAVGVTSHQTHLPRSS